MYRVYMLSNAQLQQINGHIGPCTLTHSSSLMMVCTCMGNDWESCIEAELVMVAFIGSEKTFGFSPLGQTYFMYVWFADCNVSRYVVLALMG